MRVVARLAVGPRLVHHPQIRVGAAVALDPRDVGLLIDERSHVDADAHRRSRPLVAPVGLVPLGCRVLVPRVGVAAAVLGGEGSVGVDGGGGGALVGGVGVVEQGGDVSHRAQGAQTRVVSRLLDLRRRLEAIGGGDEEGAAVRVVGERVAPPRLRRPHLIDALPQLCRERV